MRALREDVRRLRAGDLAIDDVHVAIAAQGVERPLRAHGDTALGAFDGGRNGHANLAGRFAVRLAWTAAREEERHDHVLARARRGSEHSRELPEDAVAVSGDDRGHWVGFDSETRVA